MTILERIVAIHIGLCLDSALVALEMAYPFPFGP